MRTISSILETFRRAMAASRRLHELERTRGHYRTPSEMAEIQAILARDESRH